MMVELRPHTPNSANLMATAILDIDHEEIQKLAKWLNQSNLDNHSFLQKAHLHLVKILRPVYSVDECQCASRTLQNGRGSCSQRMACLEAVARARGIPTRVRAFRVKGSFWYPRFRFARGFIPRRILLVWPQFYVSEGWLDFDELHAPMEQLAAGTADGFKNDGESLFEAVRNTPVDFLGKTCGLACAKPEQNLSRFVVVDEGIIDTRDEAFERFGSFQSTLRGKVFEFVFGDRKSS
jgi:Transglutaminase-like superfamily